MMKLKLAISAVLLAMAVTVFFVQHQVQMKLREENALLRGQLARFDEPGSHKQPMSNSFKEEADIAAPSKEQLQELLRLRGEVGLLRSQQKEMQTVQAENRQLLLARNQGPPSAAQDSFPKETWAFAGYADPESALKTLLYAMSRGDMKTMLAGVSPEEAAKLGKEFEGKSESEIAAQAVGEVTGFRIIKKEALSDDEVVLALFGDGKEETVKLKFKRFGNEWKMSGEMGGH